MPPMSTIMDRTSDVALRTVRLSLPPKVRAMTSLDELLISGPVGDESVLGQIAACGQYDPGALSLVAERLSPGDWFVDAGANLGIFSMIAGLRVGSRGGVLAFEASATITGYLETNLEQNRITNVVVQNHALWDREEDRTLSFVPHVVGCSYLSINGVAEGIEERTHCLPLDRFFDDGSIRCRMLKVDVEGAELKVLEGAGKMIARDRPFLIVEVNHVTLKRFYDLDWRALTDRIAAFGYRMNVILNDGGLHPIARSDDLLPIFDRGHPLVNLFCAPI